MKQLKRLMIVLFIGLTIYAVWTRLNETNVEYTEETYVVQTGDTLWDIAEEYCSEHQSINEYIYKVKQVNNISSDLKAGQTIIIFK